MSASNLQASKQGSGHRHPPEPRERAVRMVRETIKQTGERRWGCFYGVSMLLSRWKTRRAR